MSYTVLLSAQERPLARGEYWPAHKDWRVYLYDDMGFHVQMIDLEPWSGSMMRVYRDSRWEYAGTETHSDEWASQKIISISPDGQIEIETASDWSTWLPLAERMWPGRGPFTESEIGVTQRFSIGNYPISWPEDDTRPVSATLPTENTHGHTSIVLGIPTPEFGEWKSIAGLLTSQGHELASTLSFVPDEPEGDWQPLRAVGIEELFTPGATHTTIDGSAVIALRDVGVLRVPSGQLAAADPGWIEDNIDERRVVTVPAGEYPVTLALMRFDDSGARVGGAKMTVTDAPVARWEMALRAAEDPDLLGKDEFYGVGVDTGVAAFFDATRGPLVDEEGADTFDEQILYGGLEGDVVVEVAESDSEPNLIAFYAGWGDGAYPLWIGRADDGHVCCAVIDFRLKVEEQEE
ncbi:DUF4241 domain-containing protein [Nocardia spumae]|uniref:DUF4241 domain-containing protein n=1 Tax=Nocardia spumae TaxID=2887190 RepID=UPI001D136BFF|nr:DUF4241 domain-containing protein [Nocardia spumae]